MTLAALAFAGMAGSLLFLLLTPGKQGVFHPGLAEGLLEKVEEPSVLPGYGKEEEGDPGESDAYWDMIDRILAYEEKYQIDMSGYDSMTAEETLRALEREYGALEEGSHRTEEPERSGE